MVAKPLYKRKLDSSGLESREIQAYLMHDQKHIPQTFLYLQHIRIQGTMRIFLKKNNAITVFAFSEIAILFRKWWCLLKPVHHASFSTISTSLTRPPPTSPAFSTTQHMSNCLRKESGISFTYVDKNLKQNLSMNVSYVSFASIEAQTEGFWKMNQNV